MCECVLLLNQRDSFFVYKQGKSVVTFLPKISVYAVLIKVMVIQIAHKLRVFQKPNWFAPEYRTIQTL